MATVKTKADETKTDDSKANVPPPADPNEDDWANDGESNAKMNRDAKPSSPEVPDEDYVYVTMPDGNVRAISRADVEASQKRNQAALAGAGITSASPAVDEDVYIWLVDGSVERVKTSELPGTAGTNAVNGHWERDGKVYQIVNVYPVEGEVENSK
jgi:hypothetical protein